MAGKLGPFQAVNYRVRRVPLKRTPTGEENLEYTRTIQSVDRSIIMTAMRVL